MLIIVFFLLAFFGPVGCQSRLIQTFPLPTSTPYIFTNPVYAGVYQDLKKLFIHTEYAAAGSKVVGFDSAGNQLFTQATSPALIRGIALITDYLYTFGSMQNIEVLQMLYTAPTYIQVSSTIAQTHNRNFNRAFTDPESAEFDGQIYVTTITGGQIHMYANTFSVPSVTNSLAAFSASVINILEFLPGGIALLVAGGANQMAVCSRSSLSTIFLFPSAAGVLEIKRDKLSESSLTRTDFSILDYIETANKQLHRIEVDFSSQQPTQVSVLTFPDQVHNLIQFSNVLYLAVGHGNSLEVITRLRYISKYTLALPNPLLEFSVAGPGNTNFIYTFSGVTSTSNLFTSFELNLNFCQQSNPDGSCGTCASGFQLSSLTLPNRCILPEEYPPKYGARAGAIDPCFDSNCLSCVSNYMRCDTCVTGLFLNMANFQCTTLDKTEFFGYDPANPALIRRCTDNDCLDCRSNYQVCSKCPVQYFNLVAGVCTKKANDMTVGNKWFDSTSGVAYIELTKQLSIDVSTLIGDSLQVSLTDYRDTEFSDYTGLVMSLMDDKRTIKVQFGFRSTFYRGKILFTQQSNISVFYGPTSYMSVSEEILFDSVDLILDNTYYSILSVEKMVSIGYWVLMGAASLLGFFSNPYLGTSLMRAVSYCNTFAHLNGPLLYSSDALFDTVAKVSNPLFPRTWFKAGETQAPPQNFRKRPFEYSTADGFYNIGGSVIFFILLSLPCVAHWWASKSSVSQLAARLKQGRIPLQESDLSSGMVLKSLVGRVFGCRFVLGITEACFPLVIQFSILNILYVDSVQTGIFFTPLIVLGTFGLMYFQFRFSFDFLQHQATKKLHGEEESKQALIEKDNSTKVGDSCLNPSELADFSLEVPVNKKGSRRGHPASQKSEKAHDHLMTAASHSKMGARCNHLPNFESWGYSREEIAILEQSGFNEHPEIELSVYPVMGCSLEGFTFDPPYPKAFLYYLPLLEMIGQLTSQFVLVRFSEEGMTQVFTILGFEVLLLFAYIRLKPFSRPSQLWLVVGFKCLVCVVLSLKLWNFRDFESESNRQSTLDSVVLVSAILFLGYSAVLSLIGAAKGVFVLSKWGHELRAERIRVVKTISKLVNVEDVASSGSNPIYGSCTVGPLQDSNLESKFASVRKQPISQVLPQPSDSVKKPSARRKLVQSVALKPEPSFDTKPGKFLVSNEVTKPRLTKPGNPKKPVRLNADAAIATDTSKNFY